MLYSPLKSMMIRATAMVACCTAIAAPVAAASGDLLVAPTRLELKGFRGTEVVLNNIGDEPATYRISLELRRMTPDGDLVEVPEPNAAEQMALDMVSYAPRRITLEPNQPQVVRVRVVPPANLPDGEYRVHMLFRAIPKPKPAAEVVKPAEGFSIELTPIYGVSIPVFVRAGQLSATASISDAKLATIDGKPAVRFELSRNGSRSLFGDVRVLKPGSADPVILAKGVAIYTEVGKRSVTLTVPDSFKGSLAGRTTIEYVERTEEGPGAVLAQAVVDLR